MMSEMEKVTIELPRELVAVMDRFCEKVGDSRDFLIRQAIEDEIESSLNANLEGWLYAWLDETKREFNKIPRIKDEKH